MTAWWVLGIFALALLALWFLPLRLKLRYDENGGTVRLHIGLISICLYPRKPQKTKPPKKRKKPKKEPEEAEEPQEEAKKRDIGGLIPLFR